MRLHHPEGLWNQESCQLLAFHCQKHERLKTGQTGFTAFSISSPAAQDHVRPHHGLVPRLKKQSKHTRTMATLHCDTSQDSSEYSRNVKAERFPSQLINKPFDKSNTASLPLHDRAMETPHITERYHFADTIMLPKLSRRVPGPSMIAALHFKPYKTKQSILISMP